MADPVVAELNERFGGGKELQPDVVNALKSIMHLHDLSVQDLFFKFESYSIKLEMDGMNVTMDTLNAFKQDLKDALERSNRSQPHIKTEKRAGATPRHTAANKGGDVFGMLDGLVPNTPGTGKLNKVAASAKKRQAGTPSISRIKSEHQASSPDYKSPSKSEDQSNSLGAVP